jgi:hypothetical protein
MVSSAQRKFEMINRKTAKALGIMVPLPFTIAQMVELVHAGVATATTECVVAGQRTIEVARVRITDAGRRALAKSQS